MDGDDVPAGVEATSSGDSLARGGVGALAGGVSSIALGLVGSIVIARGLGPSGKGTYDLALAWAGLLGLVYGISLPSGITFAVARRLTSARALLPHLALFATIQGIASVVTMLLVIATPLREAVLPEGQGTAIILPIAVLVGVGSLALLARATLIGLERIVSANGRDVLARATTVGLIAVLVVALRASGQEVLAVWVLWATVAGTTIGAVAQLRGVMRAATPTSIPLRLAPAVRFALPAHAANVAQFLNYRLDQFLVVFFVGTAELGTYALAVTLGQLVWLTSNSAAQVLLPKVAAGEGHVDQRTMTARVTRVSNALGVTSALLLALAAGLFIPMVYGSRFSPAVAPLLWLLPGIVAFVPVNVLASYVAGRGRPGLNLVVSGFGLMATLVLDLGLIPRFGGVGAAIASTASYTASAVVMVVIAIRIGGFTVRELLVPTAADARDGLRILRSVRLR